MKTQKEIDDICRRHITELLVEAGNLLESAYKLDKRNLQLKHIISAVNELLGVQAFEPLLDVADIAEIAALRRPPAAV